MVEAGAVSGNVSDGLMGSQNVGKAGSFLGILMRKLRPGEAVSHVWSQGPVGTRLPPQGALQDCMRLLQEKSDCPNRSSDDSALLGSERSGEGPKEQIVEGREVGGSGGAPGRGNSICEADRKHYGVKSLGKLAHSEGKQ